MPYTHKSLAFVWVIIFGLFALTGSGVVAGSWLLLLVLVALSAPALILRSPAGATATSSGRAGIVSDDDRSPLDLGRVDVYRWENEGGARRMPFNRVPEPAHAAR